MNLPGGDEVRPICDLFFGELVIFLAEVARYDVAVQGYAVVTVNGACRKAKIEAVRNFFIFLLLLIFLLFLTVLVEFFASPLPLHDVLRWKKREIKHDFLHLRLLKRKEVRTSGDYEFFFSF